MSERQGIEIDYCPVCRGVWLDRGKLDRILERSVPPPQALPPRHPEGLFGYEQDDHGREHHREGHRKKIIWKDLFD
jgi:hypothetical protein